MKKSLTKEEKGFFNQVLDFYLKYGPHETVVGHYPGAYPDNPEMDFVKWDKSIISHMKGVVNGNTPNIGESPTYEDLIRDYILPEVDDLEDMARLIGTLQEIQGELIGTILRDYNQVVEEYEHLPKKRLRR